MTFSSPTHMPSSPGCKPAFCRSHTRAWGGVDRAIGLQCDFYTIQAAAFFSSCLGFRVAVFENSDSKTRHLSEVKLKQTYGVCESSDLTALYIGLQIYFTYLFIASDLRWSFIAFLCLVVRHLEVPRKKLSVSVVTLVYNNNEKKIEMQ